MRKIFALSIVVLTVAIFGCKNRKPQLDCTQQLLKLPSDAKNKLTENLVDFQDVTMRVKANYTGGDNDQGFGMIVKMRKDSFVWVSISVMIEVARAYVTPDSFTLIDRIGKKYYVESIDEIEKFVGQELTLSQLQDLLLANPLFAIEGFQKNSDELRNDFLQQNQSGILNRMQLTGCYRPLSSEFSTTLNTRSVVVDYKDYEKEKELGMVPHVVSLEASDSLNKYNLLLEYTSLSTEPIDPFVFKIPSRYVKGK